MNSNNPNGEGGNTPPGFVPPNLFGIGAGSNNGMNQGLNPMMPGNNMPRMNDAPSFFNPNLEPKKEAPKKPAFDVDELVKKIDAKIAELEKEEEMNKKKQEALKKKEEPIKEAVVSSVSPVKEVVNSPIPEVSEMPKVEQPKKEVNLSLDDDDDDDFFDDFFDE